MKKNTVQFDGVSIEVNADNAEKMRVAYEDYKKQTHGFSVGFNDHGNMFEGHSGIKYNWIGFESHDGESVELIIRDSNGRNQYMCRDSRKSKNIENLQHTLQAMADYLKARI